MLEPRIRVGIMDRQHAVSGTLTGTYRVGGAGIVSGQFVARPKAGAIVLRDGTGREIARAPRIHFEGRDDSCVHLSNVTIGIDFHWERKEDEVFAGDLILSLRDEGSIAVMNELGLEDYLESVISSEMSGEAPWEFLRTHAIVSRSWLAAALNRKKQGDKVPIFVRDITEDNVMRWYDREDHDLYDVCADDHCQRYQGIGKIKKGIAREAVRSTRGTVIKFGDQICDARYSKACGGLTENFSTAWNDTDIPYLTSISDSPLPHRGVTNEEEAHRWIFAQPVAYCNVTDTTFLESILPDFDRETQDFFRWTVSYEREELEDILKVKTGSDFGTLRAISPLARGPSGRIWRLLIEGSKKRVVVGKELEIRRWLSRSHLYSSAFVIETRCDRRGHVRVFRFHGAGWGHGVGLCQIGAATMAMRGFTADEILGHYFPGTRLARLY